MGQVIIEIHHTKLTRLNPYKKTNNTLIKLVINLTNRANFIEQTRQHGTNRTQKSRLVRVSDTVTEMGQHNTTHLFNGPG